MAKSERKDTSVRISSERRYKLEKAAIEIGYETQTITKLADVVNYMIDNYISEAKKDLKEEKKYL